MPVITSLQNCIRSLFIGIHS
uniref:Uncharacterized protein n=1 Tax=Anguilla anguilla TaxID=7936 RepID=A0A0E9U345_ANGAN